MEQIIEPIVCKMFRKYITDDAQKEVYVYGATLILTTLLGIVSILLLSAIFFSIWDGILFLTVFSVVRTSAGGYHCKTYLKCFLLSNAIFLGIMAVSLLFSYLPTDTMRALSGILLLVTWLYIFFNAPVVPINHTLSKKKVLQNRLRARCFSAIVSLFGIGSIFLLYNSESALHNATILALTQLAIAGLMQLEKIERRTYNAGND